MLRDLDGGSAGGETRGGARHRVVLIALDACDPATVRRMAAAGDMPVTAKFLDEAARCTIRNPYGLFVGATWANFATGVHPDRHLFYGWDRIDPRDYAYRLKPHGVHFPGFWDALGEAGRRVALIDIPHARYVEPVNGVAIAEWGCHDRHYGFHTQPPGRAAAIVERFGMHPLFAPDPYAVRDFAPDDHAHRATTYRTEAEYAALTRDLLAGIAAKTPLVGALLAEEPWDLFVAVFGEGHAAGHQMWHLHDPDHAGFDAGARAAAGGDPIAAIYRALDDAVGALLERVEPDATVMLLFSHGMGRHHDGTHLLAEILRRLDRDYREAGRSASDLAKRGKQALVPGALRLGAALGLPRPLARAIARKLGARGLGTAAERARQAFFIAPNNHVYGGIRFNLKGREARGWIDEAEAESLAARLERDLLALVNVDTGRPIVRSVRRSDAFFRRSDGDSMPDLFLDWERSAPIEAARSPRIGTVRAPYDCWRTGDHRLAGMLLARGPGLPAGQAFARMRMEDLPISIAARLGVALQDVDGAAVPWLPGAGSRGAVSPAPAGRERQS